MIRLLMGVGDLQRIRFGRSPLAELAESLYLLSSGQIPQPHHAWFEMVRPGLQRVDMQLLRAVVPARPVVADFLFPRAAGPGTTIEQQLQLVAEYPTGRLRQDLSDVWGDAALPAPAQALLADGAGRLADALWGFWQAAIGPYWDRIRALLDADVAYRAARLANSGIAGLLADLHPEVELRDHTIEIATPRHACECELAGTGLLLVPSVFAWPNLVVGATSSPTPQLTYGARGIGTLWHSTNSRMPTGRHVLGELLGRSRAAILLCLDPPRCTTDLARELDQSPPAVSAHLSVLRRSGLVTSTRSGRRVLYQRTPLATSIITASSATGGDDSR